MANFSVQQTFPASMDTWRKDHHSPTIRFPVMTALKNEQNEALDFSARTPSPVETKQSIDNNVVDLSTRGRFNQSLDENSSSASSVASCSSPPSSSDSLGHRPVILPALLNQEPISPTINTMVKKLPQVTRPFKAYPKDPLNLPIGFVGGITPVDSIINSASNEAYVEFRKQMLAQVVAVKSKRLSPIPSTRINNLDQNHGAAQPDEAGSPQQPSSSATDPSVPYLNGKDAAYWERRRKNNEAAKRSRDARRAKEDEIAIRAAFLEQENLRLKYENAALRNENSRLRCLNYSN